MSGVAVVGRAGYEVRAVRLLGGDGGMRSV